MRISDWSSDVCSSDLAAGIETGDMAACNAGVDLAYLAVGHELGLFQRTLYRIDGRFDIDHHPFAHALGSCLPRPNSSKRPSGKISATHATTLLVPISSATIRSLIARGHVFSFVDGGETGDQGIVKTLVKRKNEEQ